MAEHTPTPWRNACFQVYGADNTRVAHTGMGQLPPSRAPESEANAAFIVKAVNSHRPMREALLRLEQACEQLAATRSHAIYSVMIDGGQTQALLELDNARRCAREALNGAVGSPTERGK